MTRRRDSRRTPHFLIWLFGPKIASVDGICHSTDSTNILYLVVKTGPYNLRSHLNVSIFSLPDWVDVQNDDGLDAFMFFFQAGTDLPTYHPPSSGARENSQSNGKTGSLPYSTKRTTRRSAETTKASGSCHTRVRCSLKWLPGLLSITVRPRDCHRSSRAGFDRIARLRTLCLWCTCCRKLGAR